MAEVVHEVHHDDSSSSSLGLILGIVLFAIIALLLFYFFGRGFGNTNTPSVQIPDKVDVNLNQPGQVSK